MSSKKIDAKELLRKFSSKEADVRTKEFVSPYNEKTKTAIVSIDGLVYKFAISGFNGSGIGRFKPANALSAVYVSEAEFDERIIYLESLPVLNVILSYQNDKGWIAVPHDANLAKNRFGIEGPLIVHNVSDAQAFDTIKTRYDGNSFWYEDFASFADLIKSQEMRTAFSMYAKKKEIRIPKTTPEDNAAFELAKKSWEFFVKTSTESRIKELLENGGANLGSYVVRGDNIEIKWKSSSGSKYNSVVKKDTFDVVTSGICLSGQDLKFHLKDLPGIIERGERRGLIHRTN